MTHKNRFTNDGTGCYLFHLQSLDFKWLRKRSWALRGRNPTRDTQPDSAPTVHQPLAGSDLPGVLLPLSPFDTRAMP